MSEPLVSIVMIFLDEVRFLGEAIESVLAQDESSWELLLVDDGSTDRSSEIARVYAGWDERIRLLEHPGHENRGMGASRELALSHARGELTSFLDGDDTWFPDSLSRQIDLMRRHPDAGMVCGATLWWHGWDGGRGDSCDTVAARVSARDALIDPPGFATAMILDGAAVPCNCSTIVRTEALREVGGFDVSFRDMYEDQMLYAKLGLERPVVVTSECLGRYRQHDAQCCVRAQRSGTVVDARRRFLEWLDDWTRGRAICDISLRRALAEALSAVPAASVAGEASSPAP